MNIVIEVVFIFAMFLLGVIIGKVTRSKIEVSTQKIDGRLYVEKDDEQPAIFLELNQETMRDLYNRDTVCLWVKFVDTQK